MSYSKLATLMLLLLVSATPLPITDAAEYTVEIDEQSVHVRLAVGFQHNLTLLDPNLAIPALNGSFTPQNSSHVVDAITAAIKSQVPDSKIEDFNMQIRFEPWSETTKLQNLNMEASFRLVGAVERSGDVLLVNMAWKAFEVAEDVLLEGVSLNKIGESYLADPAQRLADSQPSTGFGALRIHWEGLPVPQHGVREIVSRISIMDFSKLETPIVEWSNNLDLKTASTTFTLETGTRTVLSIRIVIPEPEQEVEIPYLLTTKLDAEVKTGGLATAREDALTVDLGTGFQPLLMSIVIGSLVIALVAAYLAERRITQRVFSRTRRNR